MSDQRLGLHDLQAAVAVAHKRSFRQAAIERGVSTTALSNSIAKLEASLESRLFNRTTRSVSLTEAGKMFMERVAPPLQELRGGLEAVRSHSAGPSGILRINAFASAAREALLPLVLAFLQRHPQVHVDLVTEGRLVDIVAEGFDLGVRSANLIPSDMIAISLGQPQRYAVVGSPGYIDQHGIPDSPADLAQHRCLRIRLPSGEIYPWHFEHDGEVQKVDVDGQLTLDDATIAKTVVQQGLGLGFFMERDVHREIAAGTLVQVLQDWTPAKDDLCLYYPNRRNPSAALKAFTDLARSNLHPAHHASLPRQA